LDEIERLTSYLDGGLAADERRALEADLAGDSALRARLQALRAADGALEELAPTELPDGARTRLDARLSGVLEEVLAAERPAALPATLEEVVGDAPTTAEATQTLPDEVAERRRRRGVQALSGIAAGLVLLAGGLVGLGQIGLLSGGDDRLASDSVEADMSTEAARGSAPSAALEADGLSDLPLVIDEGRNTATADLDELLTSPQLQALAGRSLSPEEGDLLAVRLQQRLLGDRADTAGGPQTDGDGPAVTEEQAEDELGDPSSAATGTAPVDAAIITRDGRALPPEDAAAVRRCLTSLLEAGTQAIPTRIELLRVEGVPAIAYGLITLDPGTDAFTRTELWTVERSSCQVVRFTQS